MGHTPNTGTPIAGVPLAGQPEGPGSVLTLEPTGSPMALTRYASGQQMSVGIDGPETLKRFIRSSGASTVAEMEDVILEEMKRRSLQLQRVSDAVPCPLHQLCVCVCVTRV